MSEGKKYYTTEEIAEIYSINVNTLCWWRSQSMGPRYFKLGKPVRYSIAEVDKFFEQRLTKTTEMDGLLEKW